jgi:hypothetical protein
MVDALRKRGFDKIFVIADASLYGVEDRQILHELEKKSLLKKAPSKAEADRFIIEYAKESDALIITNDLFKDWSEKDSWVGKNIDRYLVKFMIVGNVVTFGEYKYSENIDRRLRGKAEKNADTYDNDDDW